jgi:hypothetical protein
VSVFTNENESFYLKSNKEDTLCQIKHLE